MGLAALDAIYEQFQEIRANYKFVDFDLQRQQGLRCAFHGPA